MRTILILILLVGVAFAQDASITEPNVPTEVAPGITVTVNVGGSEDPLEVAQEVFAYPRAVDAEIPYDRDTVRVQVQLVSRFNTQVDVQSDGLVAQGRERVTLPPGVPISVNFTAFEPHEGVIQVYNTGGRLIRSIPYVVTKQSRIQQTIAGSVSSGLATDFNNVLEVEPVDLNFGYGLRERETGIGGQATLGYEVGGDLTIRGTISGSYSW